jgi:hypothetical protein
MARLPTVTRQLAERRARLAGEIPRLERLVAEASEQLTKARAELAAVDLILPTFDARVDPALIAPIAGRVGRYGKRGAFKNELVRMLGAVAPECISTAELSMKLRHRFELELVGPEQIGNWNKGVLRPQLRKLLKEGVIERLKVTDGHSDDAYWRMVPVAAAGSLEELRAQTQT